jgi:hypothetical protein
VYEQKHKLTSWNGGRVYVWVSMVLLVCWNFEQKQGLCHGVLEDQWFHWQLCQDCQLQQLQQLQQLWQWKRPVVQLFGTSGDIGTKYGTAHQSITVKITKAKLLGVLWVPLSLHMLLPLYLYSWVSLPCGCPCPCTAELERPPCGCPCPCNIVLERLPRACLCPCMVGLHLTRHVAGCATVTRSRTCYWFCLCWLPDDGGGGGEWVFVPEHRK